MPGTTIGEGWSDYRRDVVPAQAHAVQLEECKRAFYAGAAAMFTALLAAVTDDDEEVCAARVASLDSELTDYLRIFKAINKS